MAFKTMPDTEALIRQLKDGPYEVKAAQALGSLREPRAVSALIDALKIFRDIGERNPLKVPAVIPPMYFDLRRAAAKALGEIGDPAAVKPLIEALDDSEVSWTAVEALTKLPADAAVVEPVIRLVGWSKSSTETCREAILQCADPGQEEYVREIAAGFKSDDEVKCRSAADLLRNLGEGVVPNLVEHLTNRDRHVREGVAELLGRLRYSSALGALKRRLRPIFGERDKGVIAAIRTAILWIEGER